VDISDNSCQNRHTARCAVATYPLFCGAHWCLISRAPPRRRWLLLLLPLQLLLLMMMLVMLIYRQGGEAGGSSSSSSSTHKISAYASALADKMLESPEMVKFLESGDLSSLSSSKTPQTVSPKSVFQSLSNFENTHTRVIRVRKGGCRAKEKN